MDKQEKLGKQKVTVALMAYNEEKTIGETIRKTRPYADELLAVISKKSHDKTLDIVKKNHVNYVFDHGMGKGEAIRTAISTVKEGVIVFMDCDGSHDPADIPRMVEPIKKGRADLIVGSRMLGGSDELHGTFLNYIKTVGTEFIQLIINYRFGVQLTDCENGFRAIRTDVAKKLKLNANDFDIEQEMVMKALRKGFKVNEVAAHEYERKYGKSKLPLGRIWWKFITRLIREL